MTPGELKLRIPESEFVFTATRSSGPGGQNINKLNTKVEMRFNITTSTFLSEYEKTLLLINLKNRINSDGELIIVSQTERTQIKNRNKVIDRFFTLVAKALTQKPVRKITEPTKKSKDKRLKEKLIKSYKKRMRSKPEDPYTE